jgi:hypothetical protein
MSNHFKISLVSIAIAAGLLFGLFSCAKRKLESIIPLALRPAIGGTYSKPGDVEAIHIDSARHTVTLDTKNGRSTEYTGRSTTVHVGANGKVQVDRRLFGLEHAPFLGVGYGDRALRGQLGLSFAYAYKFDANIHAAIALHGEPRTLDLPLSISYNFYSNTSVFVGADPLPSLIGIPTTYHVGIIVKL